MAKPKTTKKGKKAAKKGGKTSKKAKAPKKTAEEIEHERQVLEMRVELRNVSRALEEEERATLAFERRREVSEQFLHLERERLGELKLALRTHLQDRHTLEERQDEELKVYKNKVKHLLYEQQNGMTSARVEQLDALAALRDDTREERHEVKAHVRALKKRRKQAEVEHADLVRSFHQAQERATMELRQEFERKADELKAAFRKRQAEVRKASKVQRERETEQIEARKDVRIKELMARHKEAFIEVKAYYRDITHNNLDRIKSLKDDVLRMKHKQQSNTKELTIVTRQNRAMSMPLHESLALVEDLKRRITAYEQDKISLAAAKEKTAVLEEQIATISWQQDLLRLRLEQLIEERDELQHNLDSTVFDSQQKSGFKHLLLTRKIELLKEDVEKTEAALAEMVSSTHLSPEVVGNLQRNLADVVAAKNEMIEQLHERLATLQAAYYDTISAYESKLEEHGIPIEELGFQPEEI